MHVFVPWQIEALHRGDAQGHMHIGLRLERRDFALLQSRGCTPKRLDWRGSQRRAQQSDAVHHKGMWAPSV
jgi:hypothetical protein